MHRGVVLVEGGCQQGLIHPCNSDPSAKSLSWIPELFGKYNIHNALQTVMHPMLKKDSQYEVVLVKFNKLWLYTRKFKKNTPVSCCAFFQILTFCKCLNSSDWAHKPPAESICVVRWFRKELHNYLRAEQQRARN